MGTWAVAVGSRQLQLAVDSCSWQLAVGSGQLQWAVGTLAT